MDTEKLIQQGAEKHTEIFGSGGAAWRESFGKINAEAVRLLMQNCFASIYCRPGLDLQTRELCTIAALTVLGRWPQLESHIAGALRVGCTRTQITEVLLQMHVYGGWPVTLTALELADRVFQSFCQQPR